MKRRFILIILLAAGMHTWAQNDTTQVQKQGAYGTPIINSTNVNSSIGVDDKRTYPLAHLFTFGLSIGF